MSKQSFAIIGSGALGGLYGAILAKAGHEVHFLVRSDFEHVRRDGWKVESHWGDFDLPQANAHDRPATMPECDVTIVALKTVNNASLKELLPTPTGENGLVLVLQNGLGVEADSAEVVGEDRVFGGCCFLCSNKVGPGHIRHLDYGRIVFGPVAKSNESLQRAGRIAGEMEKAGIEVQVSEDLTTLRWRKLMWNIPFNGLSVALDASTDQLIANSVTVELIRDIITEVHTAGTACGATIGAEWIEKTIDHTRTMVPYDSSMRLDFLARRPMELDAILRKPIEAAREVGVSMPKTQMLYQQLSFLQERNAEQASSW